MSEETSEGHLTGGYLTLPYKYVDDEVSYIDVFLPRSQPEKSLPIILYFHGGGLTAGNRKSWFPSWMHKRAVEAGYAFISADYQLIPPSTAHDIVDDVRDLFRFLANELNGLLDRSGKTHLHVDASSVIVSGSSAGVFCAYLSALHADPKPLGVVSLYGMGGNLLLPQYLSVKSEPFFLGREILDPKDFSQYFHPFPLNLRRTVDSPLAYHPPNSPTPGYPANPRMQLCRMYLQLGVFLDYYTGEYEPSLSVRLREIIHKPDFIRDQDSMVAAAREVISPKHIPVFPHLIVDSSFPPSFLIHGEIDSAVKVQESINMHKLLSDSGVRTILRIVEDQEHSFDYATGSEDKFASLFDEVFVFIDGALHRSV